MQARIWLAPVIGFILGCGAFGQKSELQSACDAGQATACSEIAASLLDEKEDLDRARTLMEQACPSAPIACGNLGLLLSQDRYGYTLDFPSAREAFARGCEHGDSESCMNLGYMLAEGIGGS